jgi:hypothetical protein
LFGGAAVSAYSGHLVRKLHDIDVQLRPDGVLRCRTFLEQRGFTAVVSRKTLRANFVKLILRDQLYEVIIALFPGEFRMLDVDDPSLGELDRYDFLPAIAECERQTIRATGSPKSITANVVPFEDLLISRLWPTFEPSTVHDLLALFSTDRAGAFDGAYFEARLDSAPILRGLAATTFEMFTDIYRHTIWYRSLQGGGGDCSGRAIRERIAAVSAVLR